jgi:hypothetical protein
MKLHSTVPESKETEDTDSIELSRMPSADIIRWKRAHRTEQM